MHGSMYSGCKEIRETINKTMSRSSLRGTAAMRKLIASMDIEFLGARGDYWEASLQDFLFSSKRSFKCDKSLEAERIM